jgi:mycothiol synthase
MNAPLPDGFTSRPVNLDDIEAVVSLINAHSCELIGAPSITRERVSTLLQTPGFAPKTDTRLLLDETGQIAGVVWVSDIADPHVRIQCESVVHSAHRDQEIGNYLLAWAEERARQAIPKAPDGARVVLIHSVLEEDEPTRKLLEERGFRPVRHFWRMVIEMDAPPPSPTWPTGIDLSTFAAKPDDRALALAVRDAFKDHWGYVESPIEDELERWRHRTAHDPDFDPSLWFLALAGEEIAGVSMCWPKSHEDPKMGYVGILGVRRPWRRQGVGLALLHHAFGELYRRGVRKVGLHVDATSLTGATRLYERAGMHVDRQSHAYEKELRAGKDLSTQSVE